VRFRIFTSLAGLETKFPRFVDFFNEYLGKPFKRTYADDPSWQRDGGHLFKNLSRPVLVMPFMRDADI